MLDENLNCINNNNVKCIYGSNFVIKLYNRVLYNTICGQLFYYIIYNHNISKDIIDTDLRFVLRHSKVKDKNKYIYNFNNIL